MLTFIQALGNIITGSLICFLFLPVFKYPFKEAAVKLWVPVLSLHVLKTALLYLLNLPNRTAPGMVTWQLISFLLIVIFCILGFRMLKPFKKKPRVSITYLILSSFGAQIITSILIDYHLF